MAPFSIEGASSKSGAIHFNDLKWKLQSYVEDPFKPVFTNWLCLPWWPDQGLIANDLEE